MPLPDEYLSQLTQNQRSILERYAKTGGDVQTLRQQLNLSPEFGERELFNYIRNYIRLHGLPKFEQALQNTPLPIRAEKSKLDSDVRPSRELPKLSFNSDETQMLRPTRPERSTKTVEIKPVEPPKAPASSGRYAEVNEIPNSPPKTAPPREEQQREQTGGSTGIVYPPYATPQHSDHLSPEEKARREEVLDWKAKGYLGPPTADWDGKTERRSGKERRSGQDRRGSVETIFKNKRFGKDRRKGKDRRQKY